MLTCKDEDAPDCLTAAQVVALHRIDDGPKNPRTGARIYVGSTAGLGTAASFGDSYFGQVVFERKDWDPRTLDFDRDVALSDRKVAPIVDATNPDLRSFRDHGGKLIQYHGWSDALMPAGGSIAYYEKVRAFMKPRVDGFYRLYLIPGMGHCYGGAGPTSIEGVGAEHDLMVSLERWVEQGVAPVALVGSGKAPNEPTKMMSRPICPYPQVTRYKGAGDTNDAASFECASLLGQSVSSSGSRGRRRHSQKR